MQNLRANHPDARWVIFDCRGARGLTQTNARSLHRAASRVARISKQCVVWPHKKAHVVSRAPFATLSPAVCHAQRLRLFWTVSPVGWTWAAASSTAPLGCQLHIPIRTRTTVLMAIPSLLVASLPGSFEDQGLSADAGGLRDTAAGELECRITPPKLWPHRRASSTPSVWGHPPRVACSLHAWSWGTLGTSCKLPRARAHAA